MALILSGLILIFAANRPVYAVTETFVASQVLSGSHRSQRHVARDVYRNPSATLQFFDVQPNMTVVEIWPGGGWYTEILAGHVSAGKLYAAHFPEDSELPYFAKSRSAFKEKLKASPEVYSDVVLAEFSPAQNRLTVPDASADRVVTFRNVHNWMRTMNEAEAFALFFRVLKPGGILGVVEHRARPGTSWQDMKESGYMTETYVIGLAEQAGFVLDARSEINSNPKDTASHPSGVWTLPPTLRLGDKNRARYLDIGESDRMTLRFVKPVLPVTPTAQ